MSKPTTRLLVALCAALAAGTVALGASRAGPCSASVEESRRHMEHGFSLYDKKQFAAAAAEFDAAYRAQPFSAFLCNAAMAYQEALDFPNAILRYKAFLAVEPNPPDLARLKTMVAWLEAQQAARLAAHPPEDAGASDAGTPAEGAQGPAATQPPSPPLTMVPAFRSQIVVISDPPDAPLTVWAHRAGAAPFSARGPNPGWEKVASAVRTPHDLSLPPGSYHVVIDAFKDYKRSETDIDLSPGKVYEFKANLSQGAFMGFLRVLSDAQGARVFLDDPPPHRRPAWGRAPYGALVESGPHEVWVEAPGYEPAGVKVAVDHGTTAEIAPPLTRVAHGYLRVDGNAEEVVVKVDGAPRGIYTPTGEPLRIQLPGGKHQLTLEAEGRKPYTGDVDVPRGQELGVHGRLSYRPSRASVVATGALTVGAVVGGIALFQQAAQRQPPPTPGTSSASTPTYLRVGGGISFGLSGLLGFSTVYAVVHDPTPPSRVQIDKPRDLDDDEPAPPPDPPRRTFGADALRDEGSRTIAARMACDAI